MGRCGVGRSNLNLRAEHLIDAGTNFVVGHKLTLVELAQPSLNLFAEPRVMVKVMLYELSGIFLSAAVIFCGDTG
jgi:hypothetical protein